jgi:hypothetical protein
MTSTPKSTNEDVLGGKDGEVFVVVELKDWVLFGKGCQLSLTLPDVVDTVK